MLLRFLLVIGCTFFAIQHGAHAQQQLSLLITADGINRDSTALYMKQKNIVQAIRYEKACLKEAAQKWGKDAYQLYSYYEQLAILFVEIEEYGQSRKSLKRAIYLLETNGEASQMIKNYYHKLARIYTRLAHIGFYSYLPAEEVFYYYEKGLYYASNNTQKRYIHFSYLLDQSYDCVNRYEFDCTYEYYLQADSIWQAHKHEYSNDTEFKMLEAEMMALLGLYWQRKLDYEKSRYYYKKYIEIWEQHGEGLHRYRAINVIMRLAETYMGGTKEITKSDSLIYYTQLALHKACKQCQSMELSELPNAEDLYPLLYNYGILKQLARSIQGRAYDFGDKEEKIRSLNIALNITNIADQLHYQTLKRVVELREGKSEEIIRHSMFTYQYGIVFAQMLYEITQSDSTLDKIFYYTQRMKAQQLWLARSQNNANNELQLPDTLIAQERVLLDEIQYYETQLLKAQQSGRMEETREIEYSKLYHSQLAYEEFQIALSLKYPANWEARWQHTPLTIAQVKQQLKEDEVLIEYTGSNECYQAFVITKSQPTQYVALATLVDDCRSKAKEIQELNSLMRNSPLLRNKSRQKFIQLSHSLYNYLMKPLAHLIEGKKRLIIISNGATHYLPFEVLISSDEWKPFTKLDYLIKSFEISYHYSSTLFVESRITPPFGHEGIFAFAPVYDDMQQTSLAETQQQQRISSNLRAFDESGQYLALPESEREVKQIIALFDDVPDKNTLSLRAAATEASLKDALERPYKYFHIAGHSFADIQHPKFSGIACYEQSQQQQEDGILYTGEIYNLRTQADLVTLSSCESGHGQSRFFEGLIGLNRAFYYAGAPNVMFSLWKVYDKVSAQLMIDFYKNVLNGQSYASSLHEAKMKLLEKEETASPHFWGAYLLIGR